MELDNYLRLNRLEKQVKHGDLSPIYDEIDEINTKISELQETIETIDLSGIDELKIDINNLKDVVSKNSSDISGLTSKSDRLQDAVDALVEQVSIINSSITDIKAELSSTTSVAEDADRIANSLVKDINSLYSKVSNLNARVTTLEDDVSTFSNAIQNVQDYILNHSGDIISITTEIGNLIKWITGLDIPNVVEQVNNLVNQVQDMNLTLDKLSEITIVYNDKMTQLQEVQQNIEVEKTTSLGITFSVLADGEQFGNNSLSPISGATTLIVPVWFAGTHTMSIHHEDTDEQYSYVVHTAGGNLVCGRNYIYYLHDGDVDGLGIEHISNLSHADDWSMVIEVSDDRLTFTISLYINGVLDRTKETPKKIDEWGMITIYCHNNVIKCIVDLCNGYDSPTSVTVFPVPSMFGGGSIKDEGIPILAYHESSEFLYKQEQYVVDTLDKPVCYYHAISLIAQLNQEILDTLYNKVIQMSVERLKTDGALGAIEAATIKTFSNINNKVNTLWDSTIRTSDVRVATLGQVQLGMNIDVTHTTYIWSHMLHIDSSYFQFPWRVSLDSSNKFCMNVHTVQNTNSVPLAAPIQTGSLSVTGHLEAVKPNNPPQSIFYADEDTPDNDRSRLLAFSGSAYDKDGGGEVSAIMTVNPKRGDDLHPILDFKTDEGMETSLTFTFVMTQNIIAAFGAAIISAGIVNVKIGEFESHDYDIRWTLSINEQTNILTATGSIDVSDSFKFALSLTPDYPDLPVAFHRTWVSWAIENNQTMHDSNADVEETWDRIVATWKESGYDPGKKSNHDFNTHTSGFNKIRMQYGGGDDYSNDAEITMICRNGVTGAYAWYDSGKQFEDATTLNMRGQPVIKATLTLVAPIIMRMTLQPIMNVAEYHDPSQDLTVLFELLQISADKVAIAEFKSINARLTKLENMLHPSLLKRIGGMILTVTTFVPAGRIATIAGAVAQGLFMTDDIIKGDWLSAVCDFTAGMMGTVGYAYSQHTGKDLKTTMIDSFDTFTKYAAKEIKSVDLASRIFASKGKYVVNPRDGVYDKQTTGLFSNGMAFGSGTVVNSSRQIGLFGRVGEVGTKFIDTLTAIPGGNRIGTALQSANLLPEHSKVIVNVTHVTAENEQYFTHMRSDIGGKGSPNEHTAGFGPIKINKTVAGPGATILFGKMDDNGRAQYVASNDLDSERRALLIQTGKVKRKDAIAVDDPNTLLSSKTTEDLWHDVTSKVYMEKTRPLDSAKSHVSEETIETFLEEMNPGGSLRQNWHYNVINNNCQQYSKEMFNFFTNKDMNVSMLPFKFLGRLSEKHVNRNLSQTLMSNSEFRDYMGKCYKLSLGTVLPVEDPSSAMAILHGICG